MFRHPHFLYTTFQKHLLTFGTSGTKAVLTTFAPFAVFAIIPHFTIITFSKASRKNVMIVITKCDIDSIIKRPQTQFN